MRTGGLVAAFGNDREVMQVLEQFLVFVDGQDHGNAIPFLVDFEAVSSCGHFDSFWQKVIGWSSGPVPKLDPAASGLRDGLRFCVLASAISPLTPPDVMRSADSQSVSICVHLWFY